MQTLKTAVVVALLLAVCYGAFVALNAPEAELPPELAEWAEQESSLDSLMNVELPGQSRSADSASSPAALSLPTVEVPSLPAIETPLSPSPAGVTTKLPPGDQNTNDGPAVSLPTLPVEAAAKTTPSLITPEATSDQASNQNPFPSVPLPAATGAVTEQKLSDQYQNITDAPNQLVSNPGVSLPNLPLLEEKSSTAAGSTSSMPVAGGTAVPPTSATASNEQAFENAKQQALKLAEEANLKDALTLLTKYYSSPELTHSQHSDLVDILDALAREVFYSNRHLHSPAYHINVGDTIELVAQKYRVSPEFLAKVNQMGSTKALVPGGSLKVVEGPFRSVVDLTTGELTLFVGEQYAGRFPVSVGQDPPPKTGNYEVGAKRRDRNYYGAASKVIEASDPTNPYGGYWIDLGQNMCIHGTPTAAGSELSKAGCISLSPIDAGDIYDLLTIGSRVEIR